MKTKHLVEPFRIKKRPNYVMQDDEEVVLRVAFDSKIPLILKGPTGCGKTRFIEYMAHNLGLPLVTVSDGCNVRVEEIPMPTGTQNRVAVRKPGKTGKLIVKVRLESK